MTCHDLRVCKEVAAGSHGSWDREGAELICKGTEQCLVWSFFISKTEAGVTENGVKLGNTKRAVYVTKCSYGWRRGNKS